MERSFDALAAQYRGALLDDVAPFWLRHGVDRECGGYFSCLARDGAVYDTDKFVWLQARAVWTFSMLYNRLEARQDWREAAAQGARFLKEHGRDENGDWYFALDRAGRPLVQPYNIFSDCFAVMAFAQYALAADKDEAAHIATTTFERILARRDNPKGRYNKAVPDTRPLAGLALPMILANLAVEMGPLLEAARREEFVGACLDTLFNQFLDPALNVFRENVKPGGGVVNSFEGRLLNPGHGIEAAWFIMDLAQRRNDRRTVDRAVEVLFSTLEYGWDREWGGIYYFLDAEGHPPQQLEWDQKLWWVHGESLVALSLAWALTGDTRARQWYERVHAYTWEGFPDREHGEWFGYLNRRGEVLLPLKGGKWKGFFHVPRTLYRCMRAFETLAARDAAPERN